MKYKAPMGHFKTKAEFSREQLALAALMAFAFGAMAATILMELF